MNPHSAVIFSFHARLRWVPCMGNLDIVAGTRPKGKLTMVLRIHSCVAQRGARLSFAVFPWAINLWRNWCLLCRQGSWRQNDFVSPSQLRQREAKLALACCLCSPELNHAWVLPVAAWVRVASSGKQTRLFCRVTQEPVCSVVELLTGALEVTCSAVWLLKKWVATEGVTPSWFVWCFLTFTVDKWFYYQKN